MASCGDVFVFGAVLYKENLRTQLESEEVVVREDTKEDAGANAGGTRRGFGG
jgi:hypothetical protein